MKNFVNLPTSQQVANPNCNDCSLLVLIIEVYYSATLATATNVDEDD